MPRLAWHRKPRLGEDLDVVIALDCHGDRCASAAADLLDVADHLLKLAFARDQEDHRRAPFNQRDQAMLDLRRGHALGVDGADRLQLQRTLKHYHQLEHPRY